MCYENWRAASAGKPLVKTFEFPLYSDAEFTGEVTGDSCQFFNLVPAVRKARGVREAVLVRFDLHLAPEMHDLNEIGAERYHGGGLIDEVAALASLLVGARFAAGDVTREFDVGGDPHGHPIARGVRAQPLLPTGIRVPVLARTGGERSLMQLEGLAEFAKLEPANAIILMRAARLYQNALWVAESDANLGWLLLVAAVETVAQEWKGAKTDALDALRAWKPELVTYLESFNVAELVGGVATRLDRFIGSTRGFVDFLTTYTPEPPPGRPAAWLQVNWVEPELRKMFQLIYKYRSEALHSGKPYPAPMCEPPDPDESRSVRAEKPLGARFAQTGGVWDEAAIPMFLQTFEYIARGALLAWFHSLVCAKTA